MMIKKAIIVGAGGFGKELYQLILESKQYNIIGFVDRSENCNELGSLLIGDDDNLPDIRSECDIAFIAVGNLMVRSKLFEKCKKSGFILPFYIHQKAFYTTGVDIGEGSIIYPNASLQNKVKLGKGVLVNANSSIGHDTQCDDFINIQPNSAIAGKVNIRSKVYLGIGSVIIEKLTICSGTTIGAGAVVIRSIDTPGTYAGNPARKIK